MQRPEKDGGVEGDVVVELLPLLVFSVTCNKQSDKAVTLHT